jgi:hypothetical protein
MKLRKALEPKTVKTKPRSMREIRVSIFMGNIDDGRSRADSVDEEAMLSMASAGG